MAIRMGLGILDSPQGPYSSLQIAGLLGAWMDVSEGVSAGCLGGKDYAGSLDRSLSSQDSP